MKNKFYITTPLYYVNAKPHIGHAYTNIACDCIARYKRLKGFDVFFLTGTDEHGQKVAQAAQAEGIKPKEFTDKIVVRFVQLWKGLTISYDDFIRTTEKRHVIAVQTALEDLLKKGDLYLDAYDGWYCTPCETFWTQGQLENNLCPDCKRSVEKISEKNYFFRTSKYQDWLIQYIKEHPDFILPRTRSREVLSFLESPLTDLCISRPKSRISWGIELPFSKEHVVYVWFDALLNYISACGYPDQKERLEALWPCDMHVIGKDILRHHGVYWPIMLKALGFKPPKTMFAHGWWKIEDLKISKSRGNIVDPQDVIAEYDIDVFRYFLLREVPFGSDGTYSEKALVGRLNSDLANDLGNLLHRSLTMLEKYFQGKVPSDKQSDSFDEALETQAKALPEKYYRAMDATKFGQALDAVWVLINTANKYIEDARPWVLSKEKKLKRLASVICNVLEVLQMVSILIYPFMPNTSEKMQQQMGLSLDLGKKHFEDLLKWGSIPVDTQVEKGNPLFPRIQ